MLTLVNQFLVSLEEEQERSANTAAAYRNDLKQFTRFVAEQCEECSRPAIAWSEVDGALIRNYMRWLNAQPYASATVARKVAAMRSFFHWLEKLGEIGASPTQALEAPRVKRATPRPMQMEEIELLLAEPGRDGSPVGLRDKALVETLYATGMRVTEVVNLDVDDVATSEGRLYCGGRHSRSVPLPAATLAALAQWADKGRPHLLAASDEAALFLNHRGRRLTRQGLWLILKRYVNQVGFDGPVTPHTLRQSFAAHQLHAGADLNHVATLLGHSSVQSTHAYLRAAGALDSAGPLLIIDGKAPILGAPTPSR